MKTEIWLDEIGSNNNNNSLMAHAVYTVNK